MNEFINWRKNDSLTNCWFAGTISRSSTKKKVSKNNIDIIAVCDDLIDHLKDQKYKFNIISQMAIGANIIYREQVKDLENNCKKLLEGFDSFDVGDFGKKKQKNKKDPNTLEDFQELSEINIEKLFPKNEVDKNLLKEDIIIPSMTDFPMKFGDEIFEVDIELPDRINPNNIDDLASSNNLSCSITTPKRKSENVHNETPTKRKKSLTVSPRLSDNRSTPRRLDFSNKELSKTSIKNETEIIDGVQFMLPDEPACIQMKDLTIPEPLHSDLNMQSHHEIPSGLENQQQIIAPEDEILALPLSEEKLNIKRKNKRKIQIFDTENSKQINLKLDNFKIYTMKKVKIIEIKKPAISLYHPSELKITMGKTLSNLYNMIVEELVCDQLNSSQSRKRGNSINSLLDNEDQILMPSPDLPPRRQLSDAHKSNNIMELTTEPILPQLSSKSNVSRPSNVTEPMIEEIVEVLSPQKRQLLNMYRSSHVIEPTTEAVSPQPSRVSNFLNLHLEPSVADNSMPDTPTGARNSPILSSRSRRSRLSVSTLKSNDNKVEDLDSMEQYIASTEQKLILPDAKASESTQSLFMSGDEFENFLNETWMALEVASKKLDVYHSILKINLLDLLWIERVSKMEVFVYLKYCLELIKQRKIVIFQVDDMHIQIIRYAEKNMEID